MSKVDLNLYSYENLLKNLIDLLQNQVLALVKLHGIDKTWSSAFSSLYIQMQGIEYHRPRDGRYTFICTDLFEYINSSESQASKPRVGALFNKNRNLTVEKPTRGVTSFPSGHRKTSSTSSYYSNMMTKILNPYPNTIRGIKRRNDDKDVWVLGDELTYLL